MLSPHDHTLAIHAHLCLAENLNTQRIAERINPDQWSVALFPRPPCEPNMMSQIRGHAPINPVTPSNTSSLRNSMGRMLALAVSLSPLRFLYAEMADVDAKERENPMRIP